MKDMKPMEKTNIVHKLPQITAPFGTTQWVVRGRIVTRGGKMWACSCPGWTAEGECAHIKEVKYFEKINVDTVPPPVVSSVQIKKPTALIDQGRKFRTE